MSGGIFPNYPFKFNIKCIIFTLVLALGYWFAPSKNIWILFLLLWLPYISLAWYDYMYECKQQMSPTLIPFGRYIFLPFKPKSYKKEFSELPPEAISDMDKLDDATAWTIFIILIFGSAYFLYKRNKK